ncbi:MAG TPA: glycosyltransferase family A protein [Anaerolineaceae bacterium]|nr:glycosyltransferase family A protein [Anaerolineaceae bacterium]
MTPLVSVIVPTYRRPDLLKRCLDALLSQAFEPQEFEIIIADDASSEETRALVESFSIPVALAPVNHAAGGFAFGNDADRLVKVRSRVAFALQPAAPAIHYVPVTGLHGPAAARNAGLRVAAGEIIAFTDDDCIPAPDWLVRGVTAFIAGVDGVSGRVIVPLPENPTDYEREQLGLERSEFITANCFYRRSVIDAAGGFDERYPLAWREDSDLYFTLLERGLDLVLSPDPVVYHPIRPARWGISLYQQQKSQYNALCYKKHPGLYAARFRLRAPWFYYGIWAAVLAAAAGIVVGLSWLTWSGVLAYGLMVGGFAIQRLKGTSRRIRHVVEMVVTSMLIPFLSVYWRLRGAARFRVWYF